MQFVAVEAKIWWNNKGSSFFWNTVYIYTFAGSCPITEFYQVQNLLCVQVLSFPMLAALLYGTRVVGVSQTLRCWTDGATYIRQGGHHVGHWRKFLVTGSIARSASRRYLIYSEADFEVFRPAGVTSCTDWGERNLANFTPSVQRQWCRTPKTEIFIQIWPKCGI